MTNTASATVTLPTVAQVNTYRAAMGVCDRIVGQAAREKSFLRLKKLEADLAKRGLSTADMDRFDIEWSGSTRIVIALR